MMKLFKQIICTIMAVFLLTSLPLAVDAQENTNGLKQFLEKRDQEIKQLVGPEGTEYSDQQREQLKEMINGVIDFEAMAAYALQDTYDTLSNERKTEFVELFSTIVRDQSLNNLDIYRAEVTYEDVNVDGSQARVVTMAELKNVRTPVIYQMEYRETEWVVTDLNVDDVSTAESYRKQFQRIIRRKGFDSLMTTLRKRANRV
jgi:phospholipid transport system substrate-binding protein